VRVADEPRFAIVRGLAQLYDEPLLLRRVARTEAHPMIDRRRHRLRNLECEFTDFYKRQITVAHIFGIPCASITAGFSCSF
jgi:hypothetical protein